MKLVRLVVVALGLAAVAGLSAPPRSQASSGFALANPAFLQLAGRSQISLLADLYWLRAVNLAGGASTPQDGLAMAQLANQITTLDGEFRAPYWYCAVHIPQRYAGKWENAKHADALLRRGLEHFPKNVFFAVILVHNLIFYQRDYRAAADLLKDAATWPDAPPHFGPLATRLYAMTGQFDVARELVRELKESATDEDTRKLMETREREVDVEAALQAVDALVDRYQREQGRPAASIQALVDQGYLERVPLDPDGLPITLDETGHARSGAERMKVFEDGQLDVDAQRH
jgi:hypothetical protein